MYFKNASRMENKNGKNYVHHFYQRGNSSSKGGVFEPCFHQVVGYGLGGGDEQTVVMATRDHLHHLVSGEPAGVLQLHRVHLTSETWDMCKSQNKYMWNTCKSQNKYMWDMYKSQNRYMRTCKAHIPPEAAFVLAAHMRKHETNNMKLTCPTRTQSGSCPMRPYSTASCWGLHWVGWSLRQVRDAPGNVKCSRWAAPNASRFVFWWNIGLSSLINE